MIPRRRRAIMRSATASRQNTASSKRANPAAPAGGRKRAQPTSMSAAILDAPVDVIQKGVRRTLLPKEVTLHHILKKAIGGNRRAIIYLLEEFIKYDAITCQGWIKSAALSRFPPTMPRPMAC